MLMLLAAAAMGVDADEDGFDDSVDCDDTNPESHAVENWYPDCDGDGVFNPFAVQSCGEPAAIDTICSLGQIPIGGYASVDRPPTLPAVIPGEDCDDTNFTVALVGEWFHDCDDDGFDAGFVLSCGQPSVTPTECAALGSHPRWTLNPSNPLDCNDEDPAETPAVTWYSDLDRDGYGDPNASSVCERNDPIHDVMNGLDCDDDDDAEHPGVVWYPDRDGDGYGDIDSPSVCERGSETCSLNGGAACDYIADPDELDCYDRDPTDADFAHPGDPARDADEIHPTALEVIADNIDGDCDDAELCWVDDDNDNYRPEADPTGVVQTDAGDHDCTGKNECDNSCPVADCDDSDKRINPGQNETYYDDLDNDCDATTHDLDKDGDGFLCDGDSNPDCEDVVASGVFPSERVDCDDNHHDIHPNSGTQVDFLTGDLTYVTFDPSESEYRVEECEQTTQIDDDCDGDPNTQDGEFFGAPPANGFPNPFWPDLDGDGEGNTQAGAVYLCTLDSPISFVTSAGDCNDGDAAVFLGAEERCNGRDDDCDGVVDQPQVGGAPFGADVWYADVDGDGFGDPDDASSICPLYDEAGACPVGQLSVDGTCYVADDTDCEPLVSDSHPGAAETVDGRDSNCDGSLLVAELDCDDDGYLALTPSSHAGPVDDPDVLGLASCEGLDAPALDCFGLVIQPSCVDQLWQVPVQTLLNAGMNPDRGGQRGDCDDLCSDRAPRLREVCDGLDNDCDDAVELMDEDDDGLPDSMDAGLDRPGYVNELELDEDGDGLVVCDRDQLGGQEAIVAGSCTAARGRGDCDDSDADIGRECPVEEDEDERPKNDGDSGCGSGKSALALLPLILLGRVRRRT